jgi:hypothetical protein
MFARWKTVIGHALLPTLAMLFLAVSPADAHRLDAQCHVLPGKKVQVAARYKTIPRSTPAAEARVRVFGPDGNPVAEGKTDERGLFVFSYTIPQPLTVEVYQEGHRDTVQLAVEALKKAADTQAAELPVHGEASPSKPEWKQRIKDVVIGVGFLLALAAFVISLRTARRLRAMKS